MERDLLELVVEAHAAADADAVGREDLDVADRQLGRIEHDRFGCLMDDGVDPTVPEKVAEATSGSISMRYLSGSIFRGRRNGSEGATGGELKASVQATRGAAGRFSLRALRGSPARQ